MTTRNFYRPACAPSIPPEAVPPGTPANWPMTHYPVPEGMPDPDEVDLVGPRTDEEYAAHVASLQAEWDAAEDQRLAWREAQKLPYAKLARYKEIDDRTTTIIAAGFSYSDKVFSLSLAAQANLSDRYIRRAGLSYPMLWNALDDAVEPLELADADALAALYDASCAAKDAVVLAGADLKSAVRDATSMTELNAVVDSR